MNRLCRYKGTLGRLAGATVISASMVACSADPPQEIPGQQRAAVEKPVASPGAAVIAPTRNPPALTGTGTQARDNAKAFLSWAGRAAFSQKEEARAIIKSVRDNADIINAIAEEARLAQRVDHGRVLVALALLGETGSPLAIEHLRSWLWQPLPTTGEVVEGEIAERTALEMLEAKAVSGLAYIKDPTAEKEVLRAVAEHPSFHVRAEAAACYRGNHGDTAATLAALAPYVRKGEERILDRPMRSPGDPGGSVNKRLQAYLAAHPEIVPPEPVSLPPKDKKPPTERPIDPPPSRN
ncbi:MAG TPA: hypothetical protein VK550_26940 [Polyangiaceae bacterium]|jgi:hypothetical protein|nr:hypothetical protein [Polyangiaceae bacterium]